VQLLTTLLVLALSPVLAAAPAAPVRWAEPAPKKQEQPEPAPAPAPAEGQEGEQQEAPAPRIPSVGRVVLRADGPQEHGPSFDEAPEPPLTADRPAALRARRLAAVARVRPPVLEAPRADVRAGFVSLPPPAA
jgi:hypothetical protein